jgi:hypothetical protein
MDYKQKLVEIFATIVETRKPDLEKALRVPIAELEAGKDQAVALFQGVARVKAEDLDLQAAGRQRFPEIHGVADLLAEGLARNPDLMEEIFTTPEIFTTASEIDQAISRFIFTGQLFEDGGEIGEVLAAAAAQKLCRDTVADANARVKDPSTPIRIQTDIQVLFEEPNRVLADQRQRQQQAQAGAERGAQPQEDQQERAKQDSALSNAVNAFIAHAIPGGDSTP